MTHLTASLVSSVLGVGGALALGLLSFVLQQCRSQSADPHGGKTANLLARESSPYLLQHAYNPVAWYPWGEEAFAKARKERKLMIISIGYAACHWCHVMERESFEDEEVAKVMNAHYVSVKVDREERPDVDQIYMDACVLLNQHGGWPLNAIALPDGRPIFAGTYFPKNRWIDLLEKIHIHHVRQPERVEEVGDKIAQGLRQMSAQLPDLPIKNESDLGEEYRLLARKFLAQGDTVHGGAKGTQKFPMPFSLILMLQVQREQKEVRSFLQTTLYKMASGGLYDQLGGGFSRYTVDETWTIPHFEKMLYDNAQLISVYSRAYKSFQTPLYKAIVEESTGFMERELKDSMGGFYSSLDADSEEEEGTYYLWDREEIQKALTQEEAKVLTAYYGVGRWGNFRGKTLLTTDHNIEETAKNTGYTASEAKEHLSRGRDKLLRLRQKRVKPSLDDKVVTAWNALAVVGYCDAYESFGKERYLRQALETGRFIKEKQWSKRKGLLRIYKGGRSSIGGFLDDYATTIWSFIRLYECTFDEQWLEVAYELKRRMLGHFLDEKSQFFFYAPREARDLLVRKIEVDGGTIPSANAIAAQVLLLLGGYQNDQKDINHAQHITQRMKERALENPYVYSLWAYNHLRGKGPDIQVAVVGEKATEAKKALARHEVGPLSYSGCKENERCTLPLLKDKWKNGQTLFYVCKDRACQLPVSTTEGAIEQISSYRAP